MTAPIRHFSLGKIAPVDRRDHRTPQTRFLIDERDALLRAAAKFYPSLSARETARQLRRALLHYQLGKWRRTYTALTSPHDPERLDAVLWSLLKVRDAIPSEMTIRRGLFVIQPSDHYPPSSTWRHHNGGKV
jgi:hypothetical protein